MAVMLADFNRQSLAARIADSLRQAIKEGEWEDVLPGERHLCELVQASRPTLRKALHLLARENLIEIRPGKTSRLRRRQSGGEARHRRLVVLVTGDRSSPIPVRTHQGIFEIRADLAKHGFATEVLSFQGRSVRGQQRRMEEFMQRNRVFCCVLRSVSRELQQWFSERSIAALVLGSCHEHVKLPSLDVDYRSVCRHAAGVLLSKGHRRIALLVPLSGMAGDIMSEVGFREAFRRHGAQFEASGLIVQHNGSVQSIMNRLDDLFGSNLPPTALVVAKPQHVVVVLMYLLKRGLTVPDQVSVISRDDNELFQNVIAHYPIDSASYVRRLSRLMQQMVNDGNLSPRPNLILPKFYAGGTVRDLN